MPRYNNKEIISGIINGSDDILFYLTKKYFATTRRMLRIKGFGDAQTPDIFSDVLVKVFMQIHSQKLSSNVEFETYFFNALEEYTVELREKNSKKKMEDADSIYSGKQKNIVSDCVLIMDEDARKLLQARIAERLSFEKIALRFNFSNAVIAQFEVNKALAQLEQIVKVRLNISLN